MFVQLKAMQLPASLSPIRAPHYAPPTGCLADKPTAGANAACSTNVDLHPLFGGVVSDLSAAVPTVDANAACSMTVDLGPLFGGVVGDMATVSTAGVNASSLSFTDLGPELGGLVCDLAAAVPTAGVNAAALSTVDFTSELGGFGGDLAAVLADSVDPAVVLYWECPLEPCVNEHGSIAVQEDDVLTEQNIEFVQNTISDRGKVITYDLLDKKQVSRKRTKNTNLWKKNKRKHSSNSGQEYLSTSGRQVSAKHFSGLKPKCCRKLCSDQLTTDECERVFNGFWETGSYDVQNAYIAGCIEQHAVASHKVPNVALGKKSVTRSFARRYSVQTDDRRVTVCKSTFLRLLGVRSGRVNTVMRNMRLNGGVVLCDQRGKYDHVKQRIPSDKLQFVEQHIRSFPVNDSHYTRSHSECRQYLSANLSIHKMYELYADKCKIMKQDPVKYWCYREIFNTKFNLSFHQPRKDTCKRCDIYKVQVDCERDQTKLLQIKSEHELHLRKAENVRSCINGHNEIGLTKPDHDAFTFDLQKVFSVPYLSANEAYYCRQLSVYNLGVHSLSTQQAVMHVWNETTASRGAQDIASCLFRYCSDKAAVGVTSLHAYSDACGGQNRNSKVVLMWMHICMSTTIRQIDHKFMVTGHSFLPNDSDFGVIEKLAAKHVNDIHVPEDWCALIERCRRGQRYQVVRMQQQDFLSISELAKYVTVRKLDEDGNKVEWLKIQHIQIRKEEPLKMYYKYSVQDDMPFSCVSFSRKGRPLKHDYVLKTLYSEPRRLSAEKANDLRKLLKYVPPVHNSFYDAILLHTATSSDEVVLECAEDDDDDVRAAGQTPKLGSSPGDNSGTPCGSLSRHSGSQVKRRQKAGRRVLL